MNALSTISVMPSSKEQLATYKAAIKNEILSGFQDTLQVFKMLKFAEKAIAETLKDKDIEDAMMNEAIKYGKTFDLHGCKFAIKAVGVRYDFTTCGDSQWDEITEKINALTEERKKREAFLQHIPIDGVVDPSTGAYLYPPAKTGAEKVTITI
jgi:hypothetical protein